MPYTEADPPPGAPASEAERELAAERDGVGSTKSAWRLATGRASLRSGAADREKASVGTHGPGDVRDLDLPASAAAATTLARIDYTDCFMLPLRAVRDRTAEGWARAALEDASIATRAGLRRGWSVLGVRLGRVDDPARVLGWEVRRVSPDRCLLAAESVFGMEAELLFEREPEGLLFATMMKLNNPLVRAFWSIFSFQHRTVVRGLLGSCGRRSV